MEERTPEEAIHQGRARVLADLEADGVAGPHEVSLLEEAVSHRRWWAGQWPAGAPFVPGLLAQDMQDAMLERHGRWPLCPLCTTADGDPHALEVEPELGEDPHWVCPSTGDIVAPIGGLERAPGRPGPGGSGGLDRPEGPRRPGGPGGPGRPEGSDGRQGPRGPEDGG